MAGQLTIDTLKASTGVLATQNGMTGIAKAWVNFNGTSGAAIRAAFNVSSVTKGSTGNYTLNFTTAFADANYSVVGSSGPGGSNGTVLVLEADDSNRGTVTTTACQVNVFVPNNVGSGGRYDSTYINIIVCGN